MSLTCLDHGFNNYEMVPVSRQPCSNDDFLTIFYIMIQYTKYYYNEEKLEHLGTVNCCGGFRFVWIEEV